ncbi:nuclear GTPase SLIP-GC-like [Odontesthes bonariensis]
MEGVKVRLNNQEKTKLNDFLKKKIGALEIDKKEMVGVFGKTGAGKSSLINAVIGLEDLLPSGEVTACTSVMIKVEANVKNLNYEADIEFITEEEWEDELWLHQQFVKNNEKKEDERMSAVYGEEWRHKLSENPMDKKYFKEIPEFLQSKKKTLKCKSHQDLSKELVKYTRSGSKQEQYKDIKRWYWPLVKCVTVRLPQNDLLQHVTLVDLPGNGDHNKSRNDMWKEIAGKCSTVWIVTESNRAAADKETWEMLADVCDLIGNGGECQHIHFICTKSDLLKNKQHDVKKDVIKEFNQQEKINKQFSDDCFEVFKVSSDDFLRDTSPKQDNDIPELKDYLKKLNDCHSETLNYVSGAHGILSLIQGVSLGEVASKKTDVCEDLKKNLSLRLTEVKAAMEKACNTFDKCLSDGVKDSKNSCGITLRDFFQRNIDSSFKTLQSIVKKRGIHQTGKGKLINLNKTLTSTLTDSIDEEFKKTFPNKGNGSFNISFSLVKEELIQNHKDLELLLNFLQTEEDQIKRKLSKDIRDRKKTIYTSLTEKIEEIMQDCYKKAEEISGTNALTDMKNAILDHVQKSKDTMFDDAKDDMLTKLNELKEFILKTVEDTLMESIELALETNETSFIDVSEDLKKMKKIDDDLRGSPA